MLTPELIEVYVQHGVGVFLTIVITGLCIWMIRYFVIRTVSKMDKVGETLDKVATKMELGFNKLCTRTDSHEEKSNEAAKYVRDEHKQMIEALGRINGYHQK